MVLLGDGRYSQIWGILRLSKSWQMYPKKVFIHVSPLLSLLHSFLLFLFLALFLSFLISSSLSLLLSFPYSPGVILTSVKEPWIEASESMGCEIYVDFSSFWGLSIRHDGRWKKGLLSLHGSLSLDFNLLDGRLILYHVKVPVAQ